MTATGDKQLLESAVAAARDTRAVLVERNARFQTPKLLSATCGSCEAIVIADESTFAVAGQDVFDGLRAAGQRCCEPFVFPAAGLYAEYSYVDQLRSHLEKLQAVPIAVGSGTINDLTKLAAHQLGRPYVSVATAASMDGYTAFGASITRQGLKQTFGCRAPVAVLADLDVIVDAPEGMNASGYADLIAKVPAGADWLLADALGEEPIHEDAWACVQSRLHQWIANPSGVSDRKIDTLEQLTIALLMTGFAMQMVCSSRPASGAEHQFSHLWDMQHHKHLGQTPLHGFKVGIGTLASVTLYEALGELNLENLDVARAAAVWPDAVANDREIDALFEIEELADQAKRESRQKHVGQEALKSQLVLLKQIWRDLFVKLSQQLIPSGELRGMLREAGCPSDSQQIGISPTRLPRSFAQAYHIRKRFTVLDCARRCGAFEAALDMIS